MNAAFAQMPPIVLIRLIGGLGNQMFQYAAGTALARRLEAEPVLDVRDFAQYRLHGYGLDRLAIAARQASGPELRRFAVWRREGARIADRAGLQTAWIFERPFGAVRRWKDVSAPCAIDGYFQSEIYFAPCRQRLCAEFVPRAPLDGRNAELAMLARGTNTVSLHVRRGDYVRNAETLRIHGVCSLSYYRAAIDRLGEAGSALRFVVFSDDPGWCRQNLPIPQDSVFVDHNASAPEIDLHLMSLCHHHVIANSSFSWWGAWLAAREDGITIAPAPWFDAPKMSDAGIVPGRWIRLPK